MMTGIPPLTRRHMVQGLAATGALLPFMDAQAVTLRGAKAAMPELLRPQMAQGARVGGIFATRMDMNLSGRLMKVDLEKLLGVFTDPDTPADQDAAWLGEHIGKFLDAACRTMRYRPDAALRARVDNAATRLMASQHADGYLGTYPASKRWTGWDVWAHQYNLLGLLSYYELTGDRRAWDASCRIGTLICDTFGMAPGQRDINEAGLHVGMAATSILEQMCRLYAMGGDPRYLAFAHYIVASYDREDGSRIVSSLLTHGQVHRVGNGKAYEMLLNFLGLVDLYRLTGERRLLDAVMRGWDDIVAHQLYASGTASVGEHFQEPGQMLSLPASHVGETCVTVTWLELNWRLLKLTGEARFADQIERSLFNHLPAAQDARSGDFCYYTSYCGPKPYRSTILCCVSSGPRGLSLIPEMLWAQDDKGINVNLYMPSQGQFRLAGADITAIQETDFPRSGAIKLRIDASRPVRFALRLRVPRWTKSFSATVDGRTYKGVPGEWLIIERQWSRQDSVAITMDMTVRTIAGAPTYPDYVGLARGPQLLSLDVAANSALHSIHRVSLPDDGDLTLSEHSPATYSLKVLARAHDGAIAPAVAHMTPFADSQDGRVWLYRTSAAIPATALSAAIVCEAGVSHVYDPPPTQNNLAPPPLNLLEALSDDNPARCCTVRPSDFDMAVALDRPGIGNQVWFAICAHAPTAIRQVRFTQGAITAKGGWFDTRKGKPRVEVLRQAPGLLYSVLPDYYGPGWEKTGELRDYPLIDPAHPDGLKAGTGFTLDIDDPRPVYAVRVVGECSGDHVSCGELSIYS